MLGVESCDTGGQQVPERAGPIDAERDKALAEAAADTEALYAMLGGKLLNI